MSYQNEKRYSEDPNTTQEQPSKIEEIEKRKENDKERRGEGNYKEDTISTEEDGGLRQ
ncbi:hypothetical protein [Psychrobacillus psychrodurans]|jgi:hypothetical protein|uniref:hypothetical protein n=1 Tax=Psychrobacillus psychrodurans TaxID=126157 RepID=UPI0008E3841B|nr:hypothetical protein [Psychrobacillus psychrodurans]MCZ8542042.1 hypothetical protein [Psychrobacillus psychrodurans]SFM99973.1 hypothetical protein SAMN05421832_1116 [Psychrobacillus psychrodurans]